ncbi:hypothetical protein F7734_23390 [Scytonema sp. UIC 10036]|uniref:hypothetical protein n=1 Tax=Scytonema sp. UIC 10036 TaxID=2304196 RepID=UPI0012DAED3D|nr:hypothetical protein [Scytonema sp. UIC 10036]MUG95144.1 hypothetical protein [Scytonema sp. UIC 10036]
MPKSKFFEETYPNLCRFVEEIGWIEIGESEQIDSFVRAYDFGGTVYEGKASYPNMEAALQDLDAHIKEYMDENGI